MCPKRRVLYLCSIALLEFYFISRILGKTSAYITHNATQLPSVNMILTKCMVLKKKKKTGRVAVIHLCSLILMEFTFWCG